jgi:hypothetical protein
LRLRLSTTLRYVDRRRLRASRGDNANGSELPLLPGNHDRQRFSCNTDRHRSCPPLSTKNP